MKCISFSSLNYPNYGYPEAESFQSFFLLSLFGIEIAFTNRNHFARTCRVATGELIARQLMAPKVENAN